MDEVPAQQPERTSRLTLLYSTLVTALVTWQSVTYTGVVQWLGEWQFARAGRFYPVTTVFALLLLAALPVLAWQRMRLGRQGAADRPRDVLERTLNRSRRAGSLYTIAASCLAIAAIVALSTALAAFVPQGRYRTLAVTDAQRPVSGPVELSGYVDRSRILRIHEDAVVLSRTAYVAPILGYPGDRSEIRYFVPVYPRAGRPMADPSTVALTRGYLKVRGMPDEAANLLRAGGHAVSRRAALLYRTPAESAWPGLVSGLATGLLALVFAAGAVIETRRHRRIAAAMRDQPAGR